MDKNIKILLSLFCIMIFSLAGCRKEDTKINNEQLEIIEADDVKQEVSSGELSDENLSGENTTEIVDEKEENIKIEILNDNQINLLISAKVPDFSENKEIEFFTLKPLEEKIVNLNGKDITLDMRVNKYSVNRGEGSLVNYFSYDYAVEMIDYNVTEGSFINGRYLDYIGWFYGQAIMNNIVDYSSDITQSNLEQAIKDIGIKVGILKDSINGKEYLVFYVEEESFCTDVFYIYDDDGNLIYKGNYNWYFGNVIPSDNIDKYEYPNAIEFYENQIICYDMYMDFENGKDVYVEKEIANLEENINYYNYNKVHKLTIENGIVKDKIIKIYEKVPFGQT